MQPNAPSSAQPSVYGSKITTPKAKQGSLRKLVFDSPDSGYGSQCATPHTAEASEASLGIAPEVPVPTTPPPIARATPFSSSKALRSLSFSPQKLRRVTPATPHQKKGGTAHPQPRVATPAPKFNRYIPMAERSGAVTERFQTTKDAESLSPYEQITRRERCSMGMPCSPSRQPNMASNTRGVAGLFNTIARNAVGGTVGSFRSPPAAGDSNLRLIRRSFPQGILMRMRTAASNPSSRSYFMSLYNPAESDAEDAESYQRQLADALHIDRALKVMNLNCSSVPLNKRRNSTLFQSGDSMLPFCSALLSPLGRVAMTERRSKQKVEGQSVSVAPIKILDAPGLRDDFYCNLLAYSPVCQTLAVGLNNVVYNWSEDFGTIPMNASNSRSSWLTAIAFSSASGAKCILAGGRSDGTLFLQSTGDAMPRFHYQHHCEITSVRWRPVCTTRFSQNPVNPGVPVKTEDLLVGDTDGTLLYYIVEWPMSWEVSRDTWPGVITLVARIQPHRQRLCGLAWSTNGKLFATGGNDNECCLFAAEDIFQRHKSPPPSEIPPLGELPEEAPPYRRRISLRVRGGGLSGMVDAESGVGERHRWRHGSAVKAIAFYPWTDSIVATGGGLNDKCIHFFDTYSGATLATIVVSAQVTSLVWSPSGHEIAATFGFAQPDHAYRVAVFRWPSCTQAVTVPWDRPLRALDAVAYPMATPRGRPPKLAGSRNGCVIVSCSDQRLLFLELWSKKSKTLPSCVDLDDTADLFEGINSLRKDAEVIR